MGLYLLKTFTSLFYKLVFIENRLIPSKLFHPVFAYVKIKLFFVEI